MRLPTREAIAQTGGRPTYTGRDSHLTPNPTAGPTWGAFPNLNHVVHFPSGDINPLYGLRDNHLVYGSNQGAYAETHYLAHMGVNPQYGTATPDEVQAFVMTNWIMRPPLSTFEIALMPNEEVVGLYYSLISSKDCFEYPDPDLTMGLPYDYALAYCHELRSRIFKVRQDLWSITDPRNGKVYRIIVPPSELPTPNHGDCKSGLGQMVFLGALSLVTGPIGLLATAASAALTIKQAIDTKKLIEGNSKLGKEIGIGIDLARVFIHDPAPNPAFLASLRQMHLQWVSTINSIAPIADQINRNVWPKLAVPEAMLVGHDQGMYRERFIGASLYDSYVWYVGHWAPYEKFFVSDSVRSMLYGTPSSTTGIDALDSAGTNIWAWLQSIL